MKNNNDTYTKSVYKLLARVNSEDVNDVDTFCSEAESLAEFLKNGRYMYTYYYLYQMSEKCKERGFDKEAVTASLLRLLHDQNESRLKTELYARGWRGV